MPRARNLRKPSWIAARARPLPEKPGRAPTGSNADFHPWLVCAQTQQLHITTEQFAYESKGPDGESLVVALNLGESSYEFTPPRPIREVLAQSREDGPPLPIEPHGWAVIDCGR